ncbi:MAG: VWA domain-containing protein, partial [Chloroflexota bacterium]
VQSINENDPVAIVSFDSQVRLEQDFTTDTEQLLSVIDGLQVSGRTALYDAAVQAVQVANNAPTPRRAIVLLSDGAEFGGLSMSSREAGLEVAQQAGVPVFTIGLGFGTDRTYLEGLSVGTNASFFESPTPDELAEIYTGLAALFRTQYIITIESDIPGDGTEYEFTLTAETPDGTTPADTGTIRAPIPVPIVRLDEAQFATAFSEATTIAPTILADDELESIIVSIDDTPIETADDGSFTLDPLEYPPGDYTLSVTATDIDGDSGSASTTFSTAALASDVSFVFEADEPLTEPTTVIVNADGQTPATSATYAIIGDDISELFEENTDAENDFPLTIDPINYAPADYTLTVGVVNEGGATANLNQAFTVGAVAPRDVSFDNIADDTEITETTDIVISAETQVGADIDSITLSYTDADGNTVTLDDTTLNPATLQPGVIELMATVTDTNGQTATGTSAVTIAALPPVITIGDIESPLMDNTAVDITIESQTPILSVEYNFGDDINISRSPDANGDYPAIPLDIQTIGAGDAVLV